jgi:hypothetical protein
MGKSDAFIHWRFNCFNVTQCARFIADYVVSFFIRFYFHDRGFFITNTFERVQIKAPA